MRRVRREGMAVVDRIKQILAQAPIDMGDILRMADKAQANGASFLIAGGANARVLMLLDGIGLGRELSAVEQPCVVICRRSESLSIMLHSGGGSVKCTGMADLAQRLTWSENHGAAVEIGCPGDLFGKDKLIFAILDGKNYREQLNAHAPGCCGAMIVMDAVDAPPMEVYQFAKWLAEAGSMQNTASVLVCGDTDAPNCAPSAVVAVQMGMPAVPVVACNTAKDSIAEKLAAGMADAGASARDTTGLAREMVRCALKRLADEKERLARSISVPVRSKISLAERFEAQIPGTRLKVENAITEEQGNRLNADVLAFCIFLQEYMEELLLAAVPALKQPKEALRAFSQGYLGHALSEYCAALLGNMVQNEIAPYLQTCYEELMDAAWIRREIEAQQLPAVSLERFDLAVQRAAADGGWLVNTAVDLILKAIIGYFLTPELMRYSGLVTNAIAPLIEKAEFKMASPEGYARKKADLLKKVLDQAAGHYQSLVQETLLPQLKCEILYWFDSHVAKITENLRAEDEKIAGMNEAKMRGNEEAAARIKKIEETEQALSSVCAG